jgi:hypothetical protein
LFEQKGGAHRCEAALDTGGQVSREADFATIDQRYLSKDSTVLFIAQSGMGGPKPAMVPLKGPQAVNFDEGLAGNVQMTAKGLPARCGFGPKKHKLGKGLLGTANFSGQ